MPQVVGKAVTVVQAGGLRIDEVAGNVATTDDRLSIAYVTVDEPAEEPWLTLAYDEWLGKFTMVLLPCRTHMCMCLFMCVCVCVLGFFCTSIPTAARGGLDMYVTHVLPGLAPS